MRFTDESLLQVSRNPSTKVMSYTKLKCPKTHRKVTHNTQTTTHLSFLGSSYKSEVTTHSGVPWELSYYTLSVLCVRPSFRMYLAYLCVADTKSTTILWNWQNWEYQFFFFFSSGAPKWWNDRVSWSVSRVWNNIFVDWPRPYHIMSVCLSVILNQPKYLVRSSEYQCYT